MPGQVIPLFLEDDRELLKREIEDSYLEPILGVWVGADEAEDLWTEYEDRMPVFVGHLSDGRAFGAIVEVERLDS